MRMNIAEQPRSPPAARVTNGSPSNEGFDQ